MGSANPRLAVSAFGDSAWCRVLKVVEEFGISLRYDSLLLGGAQGWIGLVQTETMNRSADWLHQAQADLARPASAQRRATTSGLALLPIRPLKRR